MPFKEDAVLKSISCIKVVFYSKILKQFLYSQFLFGIGILYGIGIAKNAHYQYLNELIGFEKGSCVLSVVSLSKYTTCLSKNMLCVSVLKVVSWVVFSPKF